MPYTILSTVPKKYTVKFNVLQIKSQWSNNVGFQNFEMLESGIDPGTSWFEVGRTSQYCKYTVNVLHFRATPPGIIELPNKYTNALRGVLPTKITGYYLR